MGRVEGYNRGCKERERGKREERERGRGVRKQLGLFAGVFHYSSYHHILG